MTECSQDSFEFEAHFARQVTAKFDAGTLTCTRPELATGSEDSSPDFFWTSAAHLGEHGWTLEIRVPFASLRYPRADPATWRVIFYRNYPRDFRYMMFANRLPRNSNCFICNSTALEGLRGLPSSGGIVAAPYASAGQNREPLGSARSGLKRSPFDGAVGLVQSALARLEAEGVVALDDESSLLAGGVNGFRVAGDIETSWGPERLMILSRSVWARSVGRTP